MMTATRVLRVGEEPAPLDDGAPQPDGNSRRRERAKGKSGSAGRFAVLNAFADVTLATLDRAEIAVWLLLWRDTKPNGLARTSQAALPRREGVTPEPAGRAPFAGNKAGLVPVFPGGDFRAGGPAYRA